MEPALDLPSSNCWGDCDCVGYAFAGDD